MSSLKDKNGVDVIYGATVKIVDTDGVIMTPTSKRYSGYEGQVIKLPSSMLDNQVLVLLPSPNDAALWIDCKCLQVLYDSDNTKSEDTKPKLPIHCRDFMPELIAVPDDTIKNLDKLVTKFIKMGLVSGDNLKQKAISIAILEALALPDEPF